MDNSSELHFPVVVAENVWKIYSVKRETRESLLTRVRHPVRRASQMVTALESVSFVVHRGESVGVMGVNGSGKSTLLRILAGASSATRGEVYASSRPTLLTVNAALIPDLSGLENARIGCLAKGLTPSECEKVLPEIVTMSGLGRAIYRPMKTYSSGQAARLKFSIAVAHRPEILLIDEALATGDDTFKERSYRAMRDVIDTAGAVFLVSHQAKTVQDTCSRALWLHDGKLVLDGPAEDTAQRYRWWAWNVAKGEDEVAQRLLLQAKELGRASGRGFHTVDSFAGGPLPIRHAAASQRT